MMFAMSEKKCAHIFAKNVHRKRKLHDLSQEELAERPGNDRRGRVGEGAMNAGLLCGLLPSPLCVRSA